MRRIWIAAIFVVVSTTVAGHAAGPSTCALPTVAGASCQKHIVDADQDGLDDRWEDILAARFAPVVRLHGDEDFWPASVEWFLARVRMRFRRIGSDHQSLDAGQVTMDKLIEQHDECNGKTVDTRHCGGFETQYSGAVAQRGNDPQSAFQPTNFFLEMYAGGDKGGREGDHSDASRGKWPVYVHVRPSPASETNDGVQTWQHPGMIDLEYYFFYPYNGSISDVGEHEGDWEHVTVRVLADGQTIHRVFYSRHKSEEEGIWALPAGPKDKTHFQVTDRTHPIVYSAWHSHASYTNAGTQSGRWREVAGVRIALPDDKTNDAGIEWRTADYLKNIGEKWYPRDGMKWIQYTGLWGEFGEEVVFDTHPDGPLGPALQSGWTADPKVTRDDSAFGSPDAGGHVPPSVTAADAQRTTMGVNTNVALVTFSGVLAGKVVVDWDDGSPLESFDALAGGVSRAHTYTAAGSHCVGIAVISPDGGAAANANVAITIDANEPPRVTGFTTPPEVVTGQTVHYTFTATDPEGETFRYAAGYPRCGGAGVGTVVGTPSITAAGGAFDCRFDVAAQNQHVEVALVDEHGAASGSVYVRVDIEPNSPPQASGFRVSPAKIFVGDTVRYAFVATDPDGDSISYFAGYPKCGSSGIGSLVGTPSIAGTAGAFECRFTAVAQDQEIEVELVDQHGRASVIYYVHADIAARPDIAIANPIVSELIAGGTGTYQFGIVNVGEGATTGAVTVLDTLPSGLTYVSSSWTCSAAGQMVTCSYPSLSAGAAAPVLTLSVRVSPAASGAVINSVNVSTPDELQIGNNNVSLTSTITAAVLMPVSITVAPGQSAALPVTLSIPAGVAGTTVTAISDAPSIATVTPTFPIPAGATSTDRRGPIVTGVRLGVTTIRLSAPGFAPTTASVSVTLTLGFYPSAITMSTGGRQARPTLMLSAPAPSGGLTLQLVSDNTAVAIVPASIFVPEGATEIAVPVTPAGVGAATVRASLPPFLAPASLTLTVVPGS